MIGPKHYLESERLLEMSKKRATTWEERCVLVYQANVHAELAKVAMTFDTAFECDRSEEWRKVITQGRQESNPD